MMQSSRYVGLITIIRLFRKRTFFSIVWTAIYLPFVVVTAFAAIDRFLAGDLPYVDYQEVIGSGKTTAAQVTKISVKDKIKINGANPAIISYKYDVGSETRNDRYQIDNSWKVRYLNVGDTIQIKYLNESSVIIGYETSTIRLSNIVGIVFSSFLFGIAGLFLIFHFSVKQELELYRRGTVREAELISIASPANSPFPMRGYMINYQYHINEGRKISGKSYSKDTSMIKTMKPGDKIMIFVSTENEAKSCLIPKRDEIRNNWKIYGK